jgi:hypothetical protein
MSREMVESTLKPDFFTRAHRTHNRVLVGFELHLWTLTSEHSFIYVLRNARKTVQSRLFHEGTEHPKTCFERFWATFLNIHLSTFFHQCLKKCLKNVQNSLFHEGTAHPKTCFDQLKLVIDWECSIYNLFHLARN